MNYSLVFSIMGTALLYFAYKTFTLHKSLQTARELVLGIALGDVEVKVNRKTKEIDLKWKD